MKHRIFIIAAVVMAIAFVVALAASNIQTKTGHTVFMIAIAMIFVAFILLLLRIGRLSESLGEIIWKRIKKGGGPKQKHLICGLIILFAGLLFFVANGLIMLYLYAKTFGPHSIHFYVVLILVGGIYYPCIFRACQLFRPRVKQMVYDLKRLRVE